MGCHPNRATLDAITRSKLSVVAVRRGAVPKAPVIERPMVVGGKIEARPMMYLALSYDHRIVDGKEAVSFLVRVKEGVEDPRRLVLDV